MLMEGRLRWFDFNKRFGIVDVPEAKISDVLVHQDVVKDFEQIRDKLVPGARLKVYIQTRLRAATAELVEEA